MVLDTIGHRGLVQLIAGVMPYIVTAWTANIARVRLADDFAVDPDQLNDFFTGKPMS
ncbi:hypothetical protein [Novosphingobium album (ex Hu et al. 2023)]|uniref:Uncharacterized protein n=1 Tax=Novosphingobium album (ex Hu et al. 2023) TaxID=2930093 RepID=A0ABT0B5X7_9SPHN|nr:hypothetical protein [Novosphingobium album (ex Hu et al. 2023)]MCJ2180209.1 hypothetical protein [Novosphingobium album (ex Hu et al. 2023)]